VCLVLQSVEEGAENINKYFREKKVQKSLGRAKLKHKS